MGEEGENHIIGDYQIKIKIPKLKCINFGNKGHMFSWQGCPVLHAKKSPVLSYVTLPRRYSLLKAHNIKLIRVNFQRHLCDSCNLDHSRKLPFHFIKFIIFSSSIALLKGNQSPYAKLP
ncbi:hypothetical protein CEXT_322181 [Caerostris extrusa]|uniref:Transposase n=1 Tax=Caerostris extrusa TaxID=172846 RepID=A0AAV4TID0_CAEEX|nr:hypothetical protein CEXT_322181 [Caerostris extrusa]